MAFLMSTERWKTTVRSGPSKQVQKIYTTVFVREVEMLKLDISNISGIRTGSTTVEDGLNVVQASNFRGKSSLVTALRTAIGATGHYDDHPLTEGTDEGEVTVKTTDETYNVMLERVSSSGVKRTGTPYLSDETDQVSARLFACLDKDNPIRTAVRNEDDLTELLQAPLDIEDIDTQIADLKERKRTVEQKIAEAQEAGDRLPAVQETVTTLESELETLQAKREKLAGQETNKDHIEELSDSVSAKSSELANITDDISRAKREIDRKDSQIEKKETELGELDVPDELDQSREVDTMRDRVDTLDRQIDLVEDLHRANQNIIEAGEVEVITDTERSIAADEIECWVCGQSTTKADIEDQIAGFQAKISQLRDEKSELEAELEEIEKRQREIQQARQRQNRLEREIRQLNAVVDEKRGVLEEKQARKAELEDEITTLRDKLENAEAEYNKELTDVKTEIRTTETKLRNERETLESLEQQYGRLEELETEREEIQSELNELRSRKKNTQEKLRDRFNAIIADIIDEFQPGFSNARLVLKTNERGEVQEIDLEIARDIDNKGQRTSVDTLSEGEVELIGLVVALAGYHAFDVESKVPWILIDGISQLAAEHLRNIATYLEDTSDVLVTTAYPEAGDFDGHLINPDEWEVVSDETVATP
jgi:DNA repair exonuclease SbcCD ATPase subunit